MNKLFKTAAVSAACLSFSPVNASTIIDDFNDSAQFIEVSDSTSTTASHTIETASALGGFRTISIESTGPFGASAAVTTFNGDSFYAHNEDGFTSATSMITWNKNGLGLGGINFKAADVATFDDSVCYECFVLDIIRIDQGNVDLTINLVDTNGGSDFVTSLGALTGIHEISFDQFTGVDFSIIDYVSLKVAGHGASDFALNFQGYTGSEVAPVPVPAAGWLFMTGLAGFLGFNRKRTS